MAEGDVEFHPVDAGRWPDLVALFEARGGPKTCWCMATRPKPAGSWPEGKAGQKAMLQASVDAGTPIGLLGYLGDEPVAWCSVAPRSTFKASLRGTPHAGDEERIWSVTCFFALRRVRGKGVFKAMLAAAIEHARDAGASVLEAYPVQPDAPSYRFGGFVPAFEREGFVHVARAGTRRHVMRLEV